MRRTLTLGALAAAGLLRLDATTAFHPSLGARSVSGLRPASTTTPFSVSPVLGGGPRPKVASLRMAAAGGSGAPTQGPDSETAAPLDAKAKGDAEATSDVGHVAGSAVAASETGKTGEKGDDGGAVVGAKAADAAAPEGGGTAEAKKAEVKAEVAAPVIPKPTKEADKVAFSELEQAFAEARKRSLAQGGAAKPPPPPPPPVKPAAKASPASGTGAETSTAAAPAAPAAPAPKVSATPAVAKPAAVSAAKPVAAVAPPPPAAAAAKTPAASSAAKPAGESIAAEPAASKAAAGSVVSAVKAKSEGVKARTTDGQVKKPIPVKGSPPKEAEVMKIKAAPKEVTSEAEKPKAKAAKTPAKEEKTGAFSLGAESLEEFFGLTKKPRLVSTTTPPSDEPETPEMAKLDKAAVESMIAENGLNEVTLKENFRKMEAEAKAARDGETPPSAEEADASPESKKVAAAAAKKAAALSFNPVVGVLTSIFNLASDSDKEEEASAEAKAAAPKITTPRASATPKEADVPPAASKAASATPSRPQVTSAKATPAKPKAAAPKKAAAVAAAPKAKAAPKKVVVEEKDDEEEEAPAEGGLSGLLNGMFGAPVYDDEVDTLPKKGAGAPRAMPVFAPPPAPAKAPAKAPASKAVTVAKTVDAVKESGGASAPSSFLEGLFGGSKEKKAAAAKVAAPPAPAPAPVPVATKPVATKKKSSTPSMFDGLFGGGGDASKSPKTPAPTKAVATKAVATKAVATKAVATKAVATKAVATKAVATKPVATKPAKTPASSSASSSSSGASTSFLGGLFAGAKAKEAEPAPAPAPAPVPAPAPAPKAAFNLFGMGGGQKKEKEAAVEKSPPKQKQASPAAAAKKVVPKKAAPKKAAPAAAPTKTSVAKKSSSSSSGGGIFDFLGGGGAAKKSAPPAPVPEPEPVKPVASSSSNPFSSLFGGGSGGGGAAKSAKAKSPAGVKKKPKRAPVPTPPAPTPAVSRVKTMDDSFLRKVSVMLRRNQTKIKKFQQLTDRFRGGLIKAPIYYEGVEELFGEDNVEEIIGPLLAALPENDKRKTLQDVYSKAQRAKDGSGEAKGGGLSSLFGGWGAKSETASAKKGAAGGAVGADPYAFAAAKLSGADLELFKKRTVLFSKGGINARNYYDTLAKVFGDKGVAKQLPSLLKLLPQNKRKLLQEVVDGLNK